jgi:chemotaxis family two-component system sensor kinase Cph1
MPFLKARTAPTLGDGPARWVSDVLPGAVLRVDAAGRVQDAGGATRALFGLGPAELWGTPVDRWVQPGSVATLHSLIATARTREGPATAELDGRTASGASFGMRVIARAGPDRSAVGLYLADLREREALIEALALRGAELARSNRDLEQFAYVASHDLQEPLRMVGSYTELVQERYHGKLDTEADEFLGYAHEGVVRMRALIDDLLAYARLGTRAEPFKSLPVREPLDRAMYNLQEAIRRSGATVDIGPLPVLEGDTGQLAQLFQNLIGNALKFHGAKPPHVHISAVRDGAFWQFTVADDGIGIAPEYQEKIFQIFQRLHSREEYPGTGIGLSICKRVVERHGGRIWVDSRGIPGEGTKFQFTLKAEASKPIARPEATPEEALLVEQANSLIEDRLRELV